MGLLEEVAGGLMNNAGSSGSPIEGVLMNMLGGQQGMAGAGSGQPSMGQPPGGGLRGIVSSFEQAGLGHLTQSWMGSGPNQPVSPQQLQGVLGDGQVQAMANQSGMSQGDLLSQLSQHLPGLIQGMSSSGAPPTTGSVQV